MSMLDSGMKEGKGLGESHLVLLVLRCKSEGATVVRKHEKELLVGL